MKMTSRMKTSSKIKTNKKLRKNHTALPYTAITVIFRVEDKKTKSKTKQNKAKQLIDFRGYLALSLKWN